VAKAVVLVVGHSVGHSVGHRESDLKKCEFAPSSTK